MSYLFTSCSTLSPQYGKNVSAPANFEEAVKTQEKPVYQVFLIGDAGNADEEPSKETLNLLKNRVEKADKESALIFLGDNIYPHGLPTEKGSPERKIAEQKLDSQLELTENFKGYSLFIPGNHDWHDYDRLVEQGKYINEKVNAKKPFLPENGCGIGTKNLSDNIRLIVVDTQWIFEDWDNIEKINSKCDLKTREDFYEEFERQLNKNRDKTIIIAMHHPLITNGTHGGQFSWKKQLYPLDDKTPLPVLGTFINLLRKTSGISMQDNQNQRYRTFVNRITTIMADRPNIIIVSGHDHNLQYLENGNIRQIISGSGSKVEAARAIRGNDFSYGGLGYAVLDIYENNNSTVRFYANDNGSEKLLFEYNIVGDTNFSEESIDKYKSLSTDFPKTVTSQVYPDEWTKKSAFFNFLFGKHYREYYSLPVEVETLNLDEYMGGLTPIRQGGGHQTNSLRLQTKDGKHFAMRGLKKSATRFLQGVAFKEQYVEKEFEDTYTERFIMDFYTSAHPYYPFMIGELADAIGVYHTNPKLFYVPKQPALGKFNENFGDELYLIEERPMREFTDTESFGFPEDIISTNDLLVNLRKSDKYKVDEKLYIRSRLFDMLIGDWDRHEDQWRWGQFTEGDYIIYRPIPRDRDQVFPKYGGTLLKLIMTLPMLSQMQEFGENIKDIKWFNWEPYPLDIAILQQSTYEDWIEQAEYIDTHLTDEIIDNAFRNLPEEVKDENIPNIQRLLKIRKGKLTGYADEYFKVINRFANLFSTDKDDRIVITRLPEGKTRVQMYRIRKSGENLYFDKIFDQKVTKEIWIHSLNGDDIFEVKGNEKSKITLRLAGEYGEDEYLIENGSRVRIYDFENSENKVEKAGNAKIYLTNDYKLNRYDYRKLKYDNFVILPSGGYNPDDGVKLGLSFTLIENKFKRDPFTRKHNLTTNVYFATKGFEIIYEGIFTKAVKKWNFGLNATYTSPAFAKNFFGFGNETQNNQKTLGMDYNRVKIRSISVSPSIFKLSPDNAMTEISLKMEEIHVIQTEGRITEDTTELHPDTFRNQYFGTLGFKYFYSSYDNLSLPTLGMDFEAIAFWSMNLIDYDQNFPYLSASLGLTQRITSNDRLVFSTRLKGESILNDKFEFHQGATIGGDLDMRAYRSERFLGRHSFHQRSDLSLLIGQTQNFLLPVKYGILVGFDYGRVWATGEKSNKWHHGVGGGIWANGVNMLTGKLNYFYGSDGWRISIGVNIGF